MTRERLSTVMLDFCDVDEGCNIGDAILKG